MQVNIKEKLAQIKKVVFGEDTPPAAQKFKDYQLADGTTLSVSGDTLATGAAVTMAGNPAPDGEYQLDAKTIIQVANGAIVEISSPVEDTIPEELKKMTTAMAKMQQDFKALEQKHNSLLEAVKEIVTVQEAFAEMPTDKPQQKPIEWNKLTPLEKHNLTKVRLPHN